MDCTTYHIPVLLNETIKGLNIQPDGTYVDLTYGGGGHSREIVNHLSPKGRLYGFDQDLDAMNGALKDDRFQFVHSKKNRYVPVCVKTEQVDGILADLGVSSHHLDEGERGFSFRYDAPLDMRMNQKSKLTAQTIVEEYSEEELADVLYLYGELKNSRRLASLIVKARTEQSIRTTGQLANVLKPLMGFNREKKDLARVFQALRIEVNGEMKALQQMLEAAIEMLKPGGRLVILTYHSLEDRMVKNLMRSGNVKGENETDIYGRNKSMLRPVNRNVIIPSEEEQAANPRSRSAKLRIAEKTGENE